MNHQDVSGRGAIHQFAFVQSTDPALDADNEVAAYKAWVDQSTGNTLKVRNSTNTAWISLTVGGDAATIGWHLVEVLIDLVVEEFPADVHGNINPTWQLVTYI